MHTLGIYRTDRPNYTHVKSHSHNISVKGGGQAQADEIKDQPNQSAETESGAALRAVLARWNRTNQTPTSHASTVTLQKMAEATDGNAFKRHVMQTDYPLWALVVLVTLCHDENNQS